MVPWFGGIECVEIIGVGLFIEVVKTSDAENCDHDPICRIDWALI
jgi:hypothetical protein